MEEVKLEAFWFNFFVLFTIKPKHSSCFLDHSHYHQAYWVRPFCKHCDQGIERRFIVNSLCLPISLPFPCPFNFVLGQILNFMTSFGPMRLLHWGLGPCPHPPLHFKTCDALMWDILVNFSNGTNTFPLQPNSLTAWSFSLFNLYSF